MICKRCTGTNWATHSAFNAYKGVTRILRPPVANATGSQGVKSSVRTIVNKIVEEARSSNRGLNLPQESKARLLANVEELCKLTQDDTTTRNDVLSATWRLLFTTEKETLFIVQNAGLFGTQAGDVYQVIDVANSRLQNVIAFPPDGAFIVNSSIDVAGSQRVNFKFEAAKLKLPSSSIPIPPFGQGWFDNVYVDENIRVAKDIRGDILVVERDGPPRVFE